MHILTLREWPAGVPADLDPPRFGPPGPNTLADLAPPSPDLNPPTKLSENIVFNVLVKKDDTLRSSAH